MTGELILSGNEKESIQQQTFEEVLVGGVAGVLGAGNFDAPTDVLNQLFLKGRVCVYKPNPVNQQVIPVLEKILKPLIDAGYLAMVKGGATVGSALVSHEALDEIVLTGSIDTLNKIQWGASANEQEENKLGNTPIVQTPIVAELGAINPWIVVPGPQWNKRSIDKHACALAFAKLANNGHICVSPQVVIVPEDWTHREAFLDRIRFWLGQHPGGAPFYPGSSQSHAFFRQLPNAELIEGTSPDAFPDQQRPILIPNATLDDKAILSREAWCPVLSEVPMAYDQSEKDPMGYLRSAVQFAQTNISGSLSIAILIDDKTVKKNAKEFDALVADMPYGIVGVNIWPIFANSMPQLRWGAFPGHTQSGNGFLGNAYLHRNPEKTVLRAPFSYLGRRAVEIMPPRKASLLFSRLTTYKLKPNFLTQTAMFAALFFGV
jgi:acyl-CoA reductase-like NAD-dependent aldehyde dehydrogenase